MLSLQRLQLVHQTVVFGVADLRIVEHVIAVLVMPNLVAQFLNLRGNVFRRHEGNSKAGKVRGTRCSALRSDRDYKKRCS
jgi:hypothetical protein